MDSQSTKEKSCFNEHQNNEILQHNIPFWASPTYSMEKSPSWEPNHFSASQEILHILWNHITAFTRPRLLSLSSASPTNLVYVYICFILTNITGENR